MVQGRHSYSSPPLTPLSNRALLAAQPGAPSWPGAPSTLPIPPAGAEVAAGHSDKAQPGTAQHGRGSPASCQASGHAELRGEPGDTEGPRCHCWAGRLWGQPQSPVPVQVKVGKSQRAALAVDVEEGTVTVTKRGSGSPEEVIPHDKSKGLLHSCWLPVGFFGAVRSPAIGLMARGLSHVPSHPIPHCPIAPHH